MYKVAVYGSLLSGYGNHRAYLAGNSKFLGNVTFRGRMCSFGAFPAVTQHGNTTIHAELYEIDEDILNALDRLEGHPCFYERKIVETSGGPAWVYLIDKESDFDTAEPVPSGNWRDHKPSRNYAEDYYN